MAETYRDCLRDVLDMPHLQEVLDGIQEGRIEVVAVETIVPSPVAAGLLFNFINVYMYEWDAPKAERQLRALAVSGEALDDLMGGVAAGALPRPEVLAKAVARAEHSGSEHAARSADELAVFLAELGDLTTPEILSRCAGDGQSWLEQLAHAGRVIELTYPHRPRPGAALGAGGVGGGVPRHICGRPTTDDRRPGVSIITRHSSLVTHHPPSLPPPRRAGDARDASWSAMRSCPNGWMRRWHILWQSARWCRGISARRPRRPAMKATRRAERPIVASPG